MLKRIQDTDRNIIIYPEGTRRHGYDYACDLKKAVFIIHIKMIHRYSLSSRMEKMTFVMKK